MSLPKAPPKLSRVDELLSYDQDTGTFTWKIARMRGHVPGAIAGHPAQDGYRTIMIDGQAYKAHRLAWLLHTGAWPKEQIDHINRIRDDNRIENLREATKSQNQINSGIYKNNKSGYRGVYFADGRWVAGSTKNGKSYCLGRFATAEEAHRRFLEG